MAKWLWSFFTGLAIVSGILLMKFYKVDTLEARQIIYDARLTTYHARMQGYDRELENVRIESRVSRELLEQVREDTKQIKQILLNRR